MSGQVRAGDRILVVLEGTVIDDTDKLGRWAGITHEPDSERPLRWQVPISGPLVSSVDILEPQYQPGDIVAVTYGPTSGEAYLNLGPDRWQNITPDSSGAIGRPYTASSRGFREWPHRLVLRGGKPVQ